MKQRDGLYLTIYEDLKHKIEEFVYKPNERLSEISLSKKYNVSRTPIKQALNKLENDGAVYVAPQIGTFVSKINLDHVNEFFTIRYLLEIAIVDEVKANINDNGKKRLTENIKKQKELLKKYEDYDSIELSKKFWYFDNEMHGIIFDVVEKNFVWEYILSQSLQFNRFRVLSVSTGEQYLEKKINEHQLIFEYIVEKKEMDIKKIYNEHLFSSLQHNISELRKQYPLYFE